MLRTPQPHRSAGKQNPAGFGELRDSFCGRVAVAPVIGVGLSQQRSETALHRPLRGLAPFGDAEVKDLQGPRHRIVPRQNFDKRSDPAPHHMADKSLIHRMRPEQPGPDDVKHLGSSLRGKGPRGVERGERELNRFCPLIIEIEMELFTFSPKPRRGPKKPHLIALIAMPDAGLAYPSPRRKLLEQPDQALT